MALFLSFCWVRMNHNRCFEAFGRVVEAYGIPMYVHGADLAALEVYDNGLRSRLFLHYDIGRLAYFFRSL
jgi:hypothetical protein